MTNKREMYDAIVQEVQSDMGQITAPDFDYLTSIDHTAVMLPNALSLSHDISAFSDYSVRDALMVTATEDEKFAFILTNKIVHTVKGKDSPTQDDIEALACAGQILTVWEQFDNATHTLSLIEPLATSNNLTVPSLVNLTLRMIMSRDTFPFRATREGLISELKSKAMAGLDE
jgi:hypothetical protein